MKQIAMVMLFALGAVASSTTTPAQIDERSRDRDDLDFLTRALSNEQRRRLELELRNPLSPLFRFRAANNLTYGAGPNDDGFNYLLQLQSIVPTTLSQRLRLIARTTVNVTYRGALEPDASDEWGVGDTPTVLYLVPRWKVPLRVGIGATFVIPTASSDTLGAGKWSGGPALGVIGEIDSLVFGSEVAHVWSFADEGARPREDVSETVLRPSAAYVFPSSLAVQLAATSTYDWKREQWLIPVSVGLSRIVAIGRLPFDLGVSGSYFAVGPELGPDWSVGMSLTLALR